MKALISIIKVRFGITLQYRMAASVNAFTQLFVGFVFIMVFDAFYQSTDKAMPMSFSQTVTYLWLGQILLTLLPWNGDREVELMIKNGDFAYEMLRPIDIYTYWYFKNLAQRIAATFLRAIPLLGIKSGYFQVGHCLIPLPEMFPLFLRKTPEDQLLCMKTTLFTATARI